MQFSCNSIKKAGVKVISFSPKLAVPNVIILIFMSKGRKETLTLLITVLITAGITGGGYWIFIKGNPNPNTGNSDPNTDVTLKMDLSNRVSQGDKILIAADTNPNKQAGVQAIATGDFPTAIIKLEASLQSNRNDPEAFIYLNNAKIGSKNAFTIAVSIPIGGNLNVAKEILRGVAQAQDEINQGGGLGGTPIRIILANDDNDPAIAKQVAKEFVKNTSIVAVVGHNSSNASLAAAPIYQAGSLVMVSPTSTAKALSGAGSYIFRTVPSIRFEADALARYAIKTARKTNFGICSSSSSSSSQSVKEEFTAAALADGGKISRVNCDLASADFNPTVAIAEMTGDNVEALLISPDVEQLDKVKGLAVATKGKFLLLSHSTMYTFKTLQLGQDVVGMTITVPWHPTANLGSNFPGNAVKLWGGDVNWRSATAYDAIQTIGGGLKQSGTREGLQKVLISPSFSVDGATGKIQFQPSGDRLGAPLFVKIGSGNRSGTGYDFVSIPNN
jgi:branched-chain amino acid transport system substrate-binding protein